LLAIMHNLHLTCNKDNMQMK